MLSQHEIRSFIRDHYLANLAGFKRSACWLALKKAHPNEETNALRRLFYVESPTPLQDLRKIANACSAEQASFQEALIILEENLDLIEGEAYWWLNKIYTQASRPAASVFVARLHELKSSRETNRKQAWLQLATEFPQLAENDRLAMFIYHWKFDEQEVDMVSCQFYEDHSDTRPKTRLRLFEFLCQELLIIGDEKEKRILKKIFFAASPTPPQVIKFLREELELSPWRKEAIKNSAQARFVNECLPGEVFYHWQRTCDELLRRAQELAD